MSWFVAKGIGMFLLVWTLALVPGSTPSAFAASSESVQRLVFLTQDSYLAVEVKRDDLVHFETGRLPMHSPAHIWQSPMIAPQVFSGPTTFERTTHGFRTSELKVEIDESSLCVQVTDFLRSIDIGSFCPHQLDQPWKHLTFDSPVTAQAYGLGQYFQDSSGTDGNWVGRVWDPLHDSMGNMLRGYAGGANNFSMFPILYGLGTGRKNYGLFFDSTYKQMWDFRSRPFTIGGWGDQLRWMVFTGDDLPALRQKYLQLTGRPPVPPKRAFGLWVSEFGFENWQEVDQELAALKTAKFPVDGFAMDLQWFGGTFGDPNNTGMGSLTWDERKFPDPEGKIRSYRQQHGVRLMLIEEPFISERLDEHRVLAEGGHLARDCEGCGPTRLSHNPWWGYGGMVDYTSPEASTFWHDYRRQNLYRLGIRDHWLDLGEPEQYNSHAWYRGFPELGKHSHADIHNIYNFRWVEGISRGYERNQNSERPFILSRSGTSCIQRFGAAMWSGDIGTDWKNLTAQTQTQMQMSLSGIDYYGSDTGGFQRSKGGVEGGTESLYSQWLAHSALFDVPVRPHAWNLDKQRPTSPAKRGHVPSNLANIKLRYELLPYYYSLAFRAWLFGEPLFPPAFYFDQSDENLRAKGHLKMIGRDLLAVTSAGHFAVSRSFYLPKGDWYNFRSYELMHGGSEVREFPVRVNGIFQLPLFARAGAIIPVQKTDGNTTDVRAASELNLKVFSGGGLSVYNLYEDDGVSAQRAAGTYAVTKISQRMENNLVSVTVDPATGDYPGLPAQKSVTIEIVKTAAQPAEVFLDGSRIAECPSGAVRSNCFDVNENSVLVYAGRRSVRAAVEVKIQFQNLASKSGWAHFVCNNGTTSAGTSVFILGDDPKLGAWNPQLALPLDAAAYPVWTAIVLGLDPGKTFRWKCLKRRVQSAQIVEWESGADHEFSATAGFSGTQSGTF